MKTKTVALNIWRAIRKKEAIAVSVVLAVSAIFSSIVVGTNYREKKVSFSQTDFEESLIFGNENSVATSTLTKKAEVLPAISTVKDDIFTPTNVAYTMENRELLAQMMYAEEGVFFSWAKDDPATIERVHKLAGSVILHRLNTHFSGAQTLADVLYAPGQYDYRTIQKVEAGNPLPAQVYVWADELLTEGALGPDTLVFQAEFPQGKEVYDHIGNQYFCCR